jgi:hypothetical protein
VRVERGQRLVEEKHPGAPRERARERDALALAARDRVRPGGCERGDAEALEERVDLRRRRAAEGDVAADAEVREQGVLLEHEPHRAALGREVDPSLGVEPRLAVERHAAAARPLETRDRPEERRLARPRRADERERLVADGEGQLEVERAKTVVDVCVELRHVGMSLTTRRSAAEASTSSAPIARAVSKSTSNCS